MVFSFNPDIPVRQIVSDCTLEFEGPAAMLCDRISSDGTQYDQVKYDPNDEEGPHRSHYQDMVNPNDPENPNIWKYATERCNTLQLNDIDEHLGMNRERREDADALRKMMFGDTALYVKKHV
ncbi:hypothetical protein K491DRAFT_717510 [Lophiostoma macrostomum CBS 122681]|uniref:Uncharacterized protein n=1 Tax=Lophiostoma macrostomum CBS 122681 TaxID=1314788 RepID=A0A6A6T332_9PLEO|nr:hypothetical protein K491DRAFT_717510 [Lophiostoma macrostomum CBS 122681]